MLEFYAVRPQAVAHFIDLRLVGMLECNAVLSVCAYDFMRQFAYIPIVYNDGQIGKR